MDDEWPMSDVRIMWCGALSQEDAVQSMAIAVDHDKDLRISKYGTGIRSCHVFMFGLHAAICSGRSHQRNMKHACRIIGVSA